ncbi:hypothetical protein KP509_17G005200 [Ceratopteris richardii]|uniref:EF-hand domain-containing protein n=1 Tax=Ceratopteris richardii TaxID=49495 RepID=A0A8T2SVJ0_CERRI|nr:hypothetical protein KP509_17G005200 [Ceratopteris richardii]
MCSPGSSMAVLMEGFRALDLDGNGSITLRELISILKALGIQDIGEKDLRQIISDMDMDNNGTIEIDEFINMVTQEDIFQLLCQQPVDNDYEAAFHEFDKDKDGNLSRGELILGLQTLGIHPTLELVKVMMEQADTNGDGVINYTEFREIMRKLQ